MNKTELRKCPFCGGEAKFVVISKSDSLCDIGYCFTIQCSKCYIKLPREYRVDFKLSDRGGVTTTLDERKSAVEAWNRRVFDKEKVIEELVELRQSEYNDSDEEPELSDGEEIYDEGRSQGRFEAYNRAIKIVEEGGIE